MRLALTHTCKPGESPCSGIAAGAVRRPVLCAMLAAALMGSAPHALAAEGITARAGLDQSKAAVGKWKPDAVLAGVGTTVAKADGKAIVWQYSFQSPSTRSCFRVVIIATGSTNTTDLGTCTLATPVGEEFVDSPIAFKAAVSGGFKPGEDNSMQLNHRIDRNLKPPRACWVASSFDTDFDRAKALMRGWCVDPKSGQFVVRLAGEH